MFVCADMVHTVERKMATSGQLEEELLCFLSPTELRVSLIKTVLCATA